ncbi:MAG: hypothetical protein COB96_02385 [Planctomycetota bacterium]|nr:MAG: hypothetical protein COB96_02385 [Planctomycetota bacterium]
MLISSTILLFALPVHPLLAQEAPQLFVERPGELEFSGFMIARPQSEQGSTRLAGYDIIEHVSDTNEFIFAVPSGSTENAVAASLMATGEFEYVEPDWRCYLVKTPDDPMLSLQWWHDNIQSRSGWDIRTGMSGNNYIAAVVDTGIDLDHPDLQASLVSGYNTVQNKAQSDGGDVSDQNGHGSMCAGCIGAIGNNGIGVVGVCWDVKLMPIKTVSGGQGSSSMSDLTQGARWAADNGAGSVSVSFSGVESSSVNSAGNYCDGQDCILLWAAGNSNSNLSGFDWSNVEVVGATDVNDNKANFSSYGKAIDVMAPGVNIATTNHNGGYSSVSGTSFSAPITNGVVAMIRMEYPNWTTTEVRQRLYDSCDDMNNSSKYGHGRVNLELALGGGGGGGGLYLTTGLMVAGTTTTLSTTGSASGDTVYFAYSVTGNGVTSIPSLGVDLGIASPQLLGTSGANGSGVAEFTVNIPPRARYLPVWLQAAQIGKTSQVIYVIIT